MFWLKLRSFFYSVRVWRGPPNSRGRSPIARRSWWRTRRRSPKSWPKSQFRSWPRSWPRPTGRPNGLPKMWPTIVSVSRPRSRSETRSTPILTRKSEDCKIKCRNIVFLSKWNDKLIWRSKFFLKTSLAEKDQIVSMCKAYVFFVKTYSDQNLRLIWHLSIKNFLLLPNGPPFHIFTYSKNFFKLKI